MGKLCSLGAPGSAPMRLQMLLQMRLQMRLQIRSLSTVEPLTLFYFGHVGVRKKKSKYNSNCKYKTVSSKDLNEGFRNDTRHLEWMAKVKDKGDERLGPSKAATL